MKNDPRKMMLSATDAKSLNKMHDAAVDALLRHANVRGVGAGVKWKNGVPTGDPALLVLVSHKLPKEALSKKDLIPPKFQTISTDVLAIGNVFAATDGDPAEPTMPPPREESASAQTLTGRVRAAKGGYSVGHKKVTAGTIATCVYKILDGGSTNPPSHGVGIPQKFFILSNNHVLANSNNSTLGDWILQPGPVDGGKEPGDRIAKLSEYVPLTFFPDVPLDQHQNLIDAAIAEGNFGDLDREIFWNGYVRGWRLKEQVTVGTPVKKTGRTTNFTMGRVTTINATVDVSYSGGRTARFKDQIITTPMSSPGDSGSLILTLDNIAVGLLFAGSGLSTIANQIENVRNLLQVEVAEQIL